MRRPADPPGCCRADSGGHCGTPRPPPQRRLLRGASPASLGASQKVDPRAFDASRVTLGVVTCHCDAAWTGGAAPWGWGHGVSTGWGESPASPGYCHCLSLPWCSQWLCPGEVALCRGAGPRSWLGSCPRTQKHDSQPECDLGCACICLPGLGNRGPQAGWFQQPKFPLLWAWRRKSGPASWAPSEAENNLFWPLPQLMGVCWQVLGFLGLFRHLPHLCLHLHKTHLLPMCLYPNIPSL